MSRLPTPPRHRKFAAPVEGRVTGAVFVGDGTFRAEVPPSDFEKDNVKRLLGTDVIDSDFRTAVLRVTGTVTQEDVPERWFMVLPLVFTFGEKQWASGTVHAYGPKTPFSIKLPSRPRKVELDPNRWILSERTSTKGK